MNSFLGHTSRFKMSQTSTNAHITQGGCTGREEQWFRCRKQRDGGERNGKSLLLIWSDWVKLQIKQEAGKDGETYIQQETQEHEIYKIDCWLFTSASTVQTGLFPLITFQLFYMCAMQQCIHIFHNTYCPWLLVPSTLVPTEDIYIFKNVSEIFRFMY